MIRNSTLIAWVCGLIAGFGLGAGVAVGSVALALVPIGVTVATVGGFYLFSWLVYG